MGKSHLIMGETVDFLTGISLPDTHDERIIQDLSKFLVLEKGYLKTDIISRKRLKAVAGTESGFVVLNFVICINDRCVLLLQYGPGSVVTRQRPAIAAARLYTDTIIPICVVTNGNETDIMDTHTGQIISRGLENIPSRKDMQKGFNALKFAKLDANQNEKENRILYTMDVLTKKECDEFTCKIC